MTPMDAAWSVLKADPSRSLMMTTRRKGSPDYEESFRVTGAHPTLSPETASNIEGVGVHVPEAMYHGDTQSPRNRLLPIGSTYPSEFDMSYPLEDMNDEAAAYDQHYNLLPRAEGEVPIPIRIGQKISYGDRGSQLLPMVRPPDSYPNTFVQEHAASGYPMSVVDMPDESARGYVSTQPIRQNTGMPVGIQRIQGNIMDAM